MSGALGEAISLNEKEDSQDLDISRYSLRHSFINPLGSTVNLNLVL